MDAIAWMVQQPTLGPHSMAATPRRPSSNRRQRMRARMNVVEDTLDTNGPMTPGQLATTLNTTVSVMYATAYAMEDDGRVRVLRHPVNGRPDVGQLLVLPWHTDEDIEQAKVCAEAFVRKRRSEAGKRRARIALQQIRAEQLERLRARVQREGEVAYVDLIRTTVSNANTLNALIEALQADGVVRVETRPPRGGKGPWGRWLVWEAK